MGKKSCINKVNISTDRLPVQLQNLMAANDNSPKGKAVLASAINDHIKTLTARRKDYGKQYRNIVSTFEAKTINGIPAGKYTGRTKSDPKNELNTFNPKKLTTIITNMVQRFGSVPAALASKFLKNNDIDELDQAVLDDFHTNFLHKFTRDMEKVLKLKGKPKDPDRDFRGEDFIQYFPVRKNGEAQAIHYVNEDGSPLLDSKGNPVVSKLDPAIQGAIAATAYEWLATNSTAALEQTNSSLHSLLGLDSKADLPANAMELLGDTGTYGNTLASRLGKTILKRLSISPSMEADSLAKGRLEMSLGFLAIATLEEMDILERQEIFTGNFSDNLPKGMNPNKIKPFGIKGLLEGATITTDDIIFDRDKAALKEITGQGKPTMTLFLLKSDSVDEATGYKVAPPMVEEIRELFSAAPHAFDKLFNNDPEARALSWTKFKHPKSMTIGRGDHKANAKQQKNLQKYMDIPYVESTDTLDIFTALNDETLKSVIGWAKSEDKLGVRRKNSDGVNRSILRDYRSVKEYIKQVAKRREQGLSTEFYLPSSFQGNARMHQSGNISPQNSKMHRALFNPIGWKVTFNPSTDVALNDSFIEAIAYAFDIESGKVGGVENQRELVLEKLQKPVVMEALNILDNFRNTGEISDKDQKTLAVAVGIGENKTHSLKGLVEYARYRDHLVNAGATDTFTTDIYKEVDGISNGPIIATTQLIPNSAHMPTIMATLAMGGYDFTDGNANIDSLINTTGLNDAYQRMGQHWARELLILKGKLKRDGKVNDLRNMAALEYILGSFTDENGVIEKVVRDLSKPRTMQTIYGARDKRQIAILAMSDVIGDGIYGRLEDLLLTYKSAEVDSDSRVLVKSDINNLLLAVDTLLDNVPIGVNAYTNSDGSLNLDALYDYKLKFYEAENIEQIVVDTYGKAMSSAIDQSFSGIIKARQPFTAAVQASVTIYNTLLSEKVKIVRAKHAADPDNKNPDRLTVGELDEITKSLESIFPKIKLPMYTKEGGGYLPLSSPSYTTDNHYLSNKEKNLALTKASFTKGTVKQLQGLADGIPYLDATGSSPMVISIQMLDSMVANHLMSLDEHMLNNHDGFSHSISDGVKIAEEANKAYYETMLNYDMGQEMQEMFYNTMAGAGTLLKEMGMDKTVLFDNLLADKVISDDIVTALLGVTKKQLFTDAFKGKASNKTASVDVYYNYIAKIVKDKISTDQDKLNFVTNALTFMHARSKDMATQVTVNKEEVMKAVAHMAQYPNSGRGYTVPNHTGTNEVFGFTGASVPTDTITTADARLTEGTQASIANMIEADRLNSSADGDVSINEGDYSNDSTSVDNKNVVEVFNSITEMDNSDVGGIKESTEHTNYLRNLLNRMVGSVMNPIELFMDTHKDPESLTDGVYVTGDKGKSGKVFIQTQKSSGHPQPGLLGHGLRLSAAQVYAHELTHHITHAALSKSPRLRKQVTAVYVEAREAFEEKYGANAFRVFMTDPLADITDPANAYEVMAAKGRWEYVFESTTNEDGTFDGLDEFIAYGMTNENFMKELASVELSAETIRKSEWSSVFEKNLQTTVANIYNRIMDFIHQNFRDQQTSSKADEQLNNLVTALVKLNNHKKSAIFEFLVDKENRLTALSAAADTKIINKTVSTAKAFAKQTKVGIIYNLAKEVPELNNLISEQMRKVLVWYNDREYGLIASIVTEMKGNTKRMQVFHRLLSKRKQVIDAAGNEAAKTMKDTLNSWFDRKLTERERTAVTKAGLKTDLTSLMRNTSMNSIQAFLLDDNQREGQISTLLDSIRNDKALSPFLNYFATAADSLGFYMVTSQTKAKTVPLLNATNIASLKNTQHMDALNAADTQNAKDIVDQLATLYSLRYVVKEHRRDLAALMLENLPGVSNVLTHHQTLQDAAIKDLFNGNPTLMQKGYTKAITNPRTKYVQGTLADKESYEDMGYVMQRTPITRDPSDPVRDDIYMFKASIGTANDMQSMIASMTRNSAKGADPYQVQLQIGNVMAPGAVAKQTNTAMGRAIRSRIDSMFTAPLPGTLNTSSRAVNNMIPKFDPNGFITEVRYMMAESTKDAVLEQQSYFDDVMPAMARQLIDKKETPGINSELVDALKNMYDNESADLQDTYLEISPYVNDKRLRDIYYMLPPKTKDYILSTWGDYKMYVSPDVLDIAFGQRKYSVTELFGKVAKERNLFEQAMVDIMKFSLGFYNVFSKDQLASREGRAVMRAKNIEDFMVQLTKIVKSNIVVRSGVVTRGNYASNIAYLKSSGMTMEKISTLTKDAISGAIKYQEDKASLNRAKQSMLVIERNPSIIQSKKDTLLKNYARKIKLLENEVAHNTSTALIEAGLMPDVVDDTDTSNIQSPYKHGLDALIDNTLQALPGKVEKVGRAVFMTEDTEGYKMMNNFVKLTDYSARFALYHHYVAKGMKHQDALDAVMAEFINFDLPTHRMLEYANNIGLVWFSKYQLRVLKHIKNLLRDHPFTSLATFLLSTVVGGDHIMNSTPGITKDVLQMIGNPVLAAKDSAEGILTVDLMTAPFSN